MNKIFIIIYSSGKVYCSVSLPSNIRNTRICVAGKDKTLLLAFTQNSCVVFDLLQEGKLINTLIHPEKIKFDSISVAVGMWKLLLHIYLSSLV